MAILLTRYSGLRAARALLAFACAVGCLAPPSLAVAQTSGTWTNTAGGTWNNTANWSGGAIASGSGAVADFSTLDITGTQTVALNTAYTLGSLSFGDTTTSSSGSWVISNGGTIGNTLTLNAGSGTTPTITVSGMGGGRAIIDARLLGTSGFILNSSTTASPGTLVLSGSNSFTGNVTVNSGTLAFQNTGTTGFALTGWTSGTLQLNAAGLSIAAGANVTSARAIVLGAGTSTLSNAGTNQATLSGIISGVGALRTGSSTAAIAFSGANTFSGGMIVGAGINLYLNNAGAGTPNAPTSGVFGTGTVTLAGGSMRNLSGSPTVTINNVVNVTADTSFPDSTASTSTVFTGSMTLFGGTRTFTADQFLTAFNGPISDGGSGLGLTKAGGKTLALGGSNSYTGATTLNSGTLRLDNQNAVRNSTLSMSGTGSLLFSSTVAANAFTFGGLSASSTAATLALSNTAGTAITLTVGGNNASTSYAGSLAGGGSVVKIGTGMLSLSGSNSYAGTMTVTGGVLSVSSSNALPGWGTPGRVSVGADGTLAIGNDMTLQQAIDAGYLAATSGIGFDTSTGNRMVSDAIAGSRPFVKTGANTLTLTGENTYTASTTVSGGTLQVGDGGTTGSIVDNVTLSNSAGIAFNRSDSLTFSASVTGTGSFTKLGAGTLTISGSNGFTGATTVAGGVLALGSANALPAAGNITFTGGTLRYSAANTTDFAARIVSSTAAIGIDTAGQNVTFAGNLIAGNSGGLTKTGDGTLTLSGSNTFTGAITVLGGTLGLNADKAVPSSATAIVLDGGALLRVSTLTPTMSNSISIGSSGGEIRNAAGAQWTVGGSVAGGAGTGSLVLNSSSGEIIFGNASSTYTGGTRILAGSGIAVQADAAFGSGTISFEGGSLRTTSSGARVIGNPVAFAGDATFTTSQRDLTFNGPATILGETRTLTVSATTSLATYNGSIGDGGNALGFTKAGVGTLILGGSNTYSGTTTLDAGTLRLNNTDALAGGGDVSFTGGTLQYSGSNTGDYSARIRSSSAAIRIDTNSQAVTWSGAVDSTNVGGLAKSGSGTLVLAAANTYSGTTTVSGGTLQIGNGGTAGSIAGNVALSNTAALVFNRSNDLTYAGAISGTGSLTKSGAGALTLSGTSTLATGAAITINGGALVTLSSNSLNSGAATFAFTIDSGTLANSGTSTSGISNKLASLSIGSGGATIRSDVRFDSTAVYSGTSATASLTYGTTSGTVSNVVVVIGGNNTYAGGTKLESGVSLYVDNNSAFGTGTLDLAGGAIQARAGTSPPRSLANAVTISANTQFSAAASNPNLTFTGATTLSGGTRTLQVDNVLTSGSSVGQPSVIFTNVIGDGGNGYGITKTGAGVLGLAGANTYSGATTLNTGTIRLQNQNALQNSTLSLSGTGGVVFDAVVAGNAFALGGLSAASASAGLSLQNSAANAIALTVGGNNASTAYAGLLTGAGSLVKTGSGTLTLGGANTYAGTTTVAAGSLLVNGNQSAAAGAVLVDALATLGGSGTIGGAVTVNGFLSPGNSPGVLTVASLDLGGSSTSLFEIDGLVRGTQYDGVNVSTVGGTTYGGILSLVFGNGAAFADNTTFDLFQFTGSPSGSFSSVTSSGFYAGSWTNNNDGTFKLEQGGQTLTFSQSSGDIVVVPEPAALALAGIGAGVAGWNLIRRRRRPA
jgi:fibronectin-binding autotransporter adhesin